MLGIDAWNRSRRMTVEVDLLDQAVAGDRAPTPALRSRSSSRPRREAATPLFLSACLLDSYLLDTYTCGRLNVSGAHIIISSLTASVVTPPGSRALVVRVHGEDGFWLLWC